MCVLIFQVLKLAIINLERRFTQHITADVYRHGRFLFSLDKPSGSSLPVLSTHLARVAVTLCTFDHRYATLLAGGGVAQWLGRRISDQGVPGSKPGRCTFRCGLEQVTLNLLSTG